jgi:hypothetical protein
MKAVSVRYERLYNVGNYEHAKFGIELAVEEGEKASDVMEKAKKWVRQMNTEAMDARMREVVRARDILANRKNRLVSEVEEAERIVAEAEAAEQEDFPF